MHILKLTPAVLFLLFCTALFAQVPEGGQRLNAENSYYKIGNCEITETTVTGQEFTEGFEVAVGTEIDNTWDAQVKFPSIAGIEEGDVVLVAFYARTISSLEETGESRLNAVIELNKSPHTKELSFNISIGQEWKQYYAPTVIKNTRAVNEVSYLFHCGFPSQTIEIADVQFLNYRNTLTIDDLPQTEISYIGQAPDASWRVPAEERINQHRKGEVDIEVYDAQGNMIEEANIAIEMKRHQFGFGTAIKARELNNNETYRNKVLEIFNEVVFENDLKWRQFNPNSANTDLTKAMSTLEENQIDIRGHCIIWPSYRFTPGEVEELSDDPVALRNLIDQRIDDVTEFTRGKLIDWDVMNEPFSEHDIQDILGDEVMADWFKRTRLNDPDVKLYINEYSIISAGGKNSTKQDYYYDVIEYIEEQGGEIDGIGMQGHMSSELTSIPLVYDIIDRFAALGKEIKITEHDISIKQRQVQAAYTRDFMTILYSHPSVKSLLLWGFWENSHWKPDGALYNSDWSIRPHGEAWIDMIYNQWWTSRIDTVTNVEGKISLEGYLGTYGYTIESEGMSRSGEFRLENSYASGMTNKLVLTLDEEIPDVVEIIPSSSPRICEGEIITLQAPEGSGLTYTWYRDDQLLDESTSSINTGNPGTYQVKVGKGAVEILSVPLELSVFPLPASATISTDDALTMCPGETATLTSSITAEDGNIEWMLDGERFAGELTTITVEEAGVYSLLNYSSTCISESNSLEVVLLSPTDPLCSSTISLEESKSLVHPNPFKGCFELNTYALPAQSRLEIYNSLGQLVFQDHQIVPSEHYLVELPDPGVYFLHLVHEEGRMNFKILGQ